jgi:hypothetical protein
VMDRVRNKPAAEAPADAGAPAPPVPAPPAAAPEATAEPEATAVPEPAAEPETVVAATTTHPETVAAEIPPEPEPATEPATASALPLANYDELSVASLRARLRNLSNDDLTQLMTHEKAHQDRPEVIKMFQNRLLKMTSGLPKLEE